jgi:hypothetical protein
MIRRRQINAGRRAPRARALGAAFGARIRDAAMIVEERVVWPIADLPARLRLPTPTVAGGVSLLVVAVVVCGVILAEGNGKERATVAVAPASQPVEREAVQPPEPEGPVLHGTAPDFTPEGGDAAAKVANRDTVIASEPDATSSSSSSKEKASAPTASSSKAGKKAEDPGPAAIDVARRFSGAFVLYETGRDNAKVRAAFSATASPRLKRALLRRPPRLPANVKVPKAKVLNVVPGPRHGDTFTLSASLLRVGITSELRIDVQRDEESGEWQVTDVLG